MDSRDSIMMSPRVPRAPPPTPTPTIMVRTKTTLIMKDMIKIIKTKTKTIRATIKMRLPAGMAPTKTTTTITTIITITNMVNTTNMTTKNTIRVPTPVADKTQVSQSQSLKTT